MGASGLSVLFRSISAVGISLCSRCWMPAVILSTMRLSRLGVNRIHPISKGFGARPRSLGPMRRLTLGTLRQAALAVTSCPAPHLSLSVKPCILQRRAALRLWTAWQQIAISRVHSFKCESWVSMNQESLSKQQHVGQAGAVKTVSKDISTVKHLLEIMYCTWADQVNRAPNLWQTKSRKEAVLSSQLSLCVSEFGSPGIPDRPLLLQAEFSKRILDEVPLPPEDHMCESYCIGSEMSLVIEISQFQKWRWWCPLQCCDMPWQNLLGCEASFFHLARQHLASCAVPMWHHHGPLLLVQAHTQALREPWTTGGLVPLAPGALAASPKGRTASNRVVMSCALPFFRLKFPRSIIYWAETCSASVSTAVL